MTPRSILTIAALVAIALVVVLVLGSRPQLSISGSDIVTGAVVTKLNRAMLPDTNITTAIWLRLDRIAAAKFMLYSRDHLNQKVRIVAGTNVVAELPMYSLVSKTQLELYFTSETQAWAVGDALFKK